MYNFKAKTAQKNAGLPQICVVVAYKGNTYQLYNRDGNQLVPINRINAEKWDKVETGMEEVLAQKLGADSVDVLQTNSKRDVTGAVGL